MKQKYTISKDKKTGSLNIKEFAELEKEMLSLLCEETYEGKMVETAMKKGKDALISELRTKNIFPNHLYMAQIADAVIDLYETGSDQPSELSFDDLEYLAKEVSEQQRVLKEMGEETTEIDELLNDIDSGLDKKNDIKTISSPLDVVDDDVIGVGDDA